MSRNNEPKTNPTFATKAKQWFFNDFLGLAREFRLSYLPPLMVYFAAGVSGFTGIIEAFFVKDSLGISAVFLASLAFWAQLPWALKMPFGHLVDLFWRRKSWFVYGGAALLAVSLLIMVGLTGHREAMEVWLPGWVWYVLAGLIAPVGYVMQDVVADAMTVEAVPTVRPDGEKIPEAELRRMHATMQTLGRVAIVGGSAIVAGVGGWLARTLSYESMYLISLTIPLISVSGVWLAKLLRKPGERLGDTLETPRPNWYILGGSGAFVAVMLLVGLSGFAWKEEAIFILSLLIVGFLLRNLIQGLTPAKRWEIAGIAVIIFVFRAMPTAGAGASWWQIDKLGFDEAFFGTLRQTGAILAIIGMFALRGWMARRTVPYLMAFLAIYNGLLTLPYIGLFYGLGNWTQAVFGFGAHTIALVDTFADSPLGQVAMVPLLAWIAREAPRHEKATYFAVMSAFTNLALSLSQILTKYVNEIFPITRGNYAELGKLFITITVAGVVLPILAVFLFDPDKGLFNKKRRLVAAAG